MTVCPSVHFETHPLKVILQKRAASSSSRPALRVLWVRDSLIPPSLPVQPPGPPQAEIPTAETPGAAPSLLGPARGVRAPLPLPSRPPPSPAQPAKGGSPLGGVRRPRPPQRWPRPAASRAARSRPLSWAPAPGSPPNPIPAPGASQFPCASGRPLRALPRPSRHPRPVLPSTPPT